MYEYLDAINFLLSQVGASPVETEDSNLPDVSSAKLRLKEASVWVQKRGWWFNREIALTLQPNTLGEIPIPENTLKILSAYPELIVNRFGRAYSPRRNTYHFDGPITVDIILLMEWESLPGSAQDAIMHRAAETMIMHELEDSNKAQALRADFGIAYAQLQSEDIQIKQRNAFSTPKILRTRGRSRPYGRGGWGYNPAYPGG